MLRHTTRTGRFIKRKRRRLMPKRKSSTIVFMNNSAVLTDKAPKVVGPYSQAVIAGDFIFCAGQIGIDPTTNALVDGGIEKETVQVMKNLEAVLAAAGSDFSKVVRAELFLADMADYAKVNELYGGYFMTAPKPARHTVAVAALPKGARIEISLIATL